MVTMNNAANTGTLLLTNETVRSAGAILNAAGLYKIRGKLEWKGTGTYTAHAVLEANDDGTYNVFGTRSDK
mgnify:CR=1 FL=1